MTEDSLPAPPPVTVSKKKRSSKKFKESYNKSASKSVSKKTRPSEKALVPVNKLPQKQFDYVGAVYKHEDDFATEGRDRYDSQLWDDFISAHPEEANTSIEDSWFEGETPVKKDYRGRVVTQKLAGARKE